MGNMTHYGRRMTSCNEGVGFEQTLHRKRDKRYMTVLIIFVFIGCYATTYIWKTLVFFRADCLFGLTPVSLQNLELAMYMWTFFNPLLNCAIYVFFRDDLRRSLTENFFRRRSGQVKPLCK